MSLSHNVEYFQLALQQAERQQWDVCLDWYHKIIQNTRSVRNRLQDKKHITVEDCDTIDTCNKILATVADRIREIKDRPVSTPPPAVHTVQKPTGPSNESEIAANIEPFIVQKVNHTFDDVIGMEEVKKLFMDSIVMPIQQPNLFQLNAPLKGVLMYGPPGTGKTFIARCLVGELNACLKDVRVTLYNVRLSEIFNKYVGETEKIISALFAHARQNAPSVLFFDEADAFFSQRTGDENEATKRAKTTFLIEMDGLTGGGQVFTISATNYPERIEDAFRRRLGTPVYIPLPTKEARRQFIVRQFEQNLVEYTDEQANMLAEWTEGYSCDDLTRWFQQANQYRMDRVTQATYFRKLTIDEKEVYVPSTVDEDDSIPMRYREVPPGMIHDRYIPIPLSYYEELLAEFKPTASQETIARMEKFRNQERK